MRIEVIFCPSCQHKLRIPDDLMGQPVQCPECRAMFLSPPPPVNVRGPEQEDGERVLAGPRDLEPAEDYPRERGRPEPGRHDSLLKVMGFALTGVSMVGLFAGLARVIVAFSPQMLRMATQNNPLGPLPPGMDPKLLFLGTGGVFSLISLMSILGGLAILGRRNYVLALAGSFAALANVGDCCCLLSAPIGITCLILLFQPGVRQSFR